MFRILYCNHNLIKEHIKEAAVIAGLPMLVEVPDFEKEVNNPVHLERLKRLGNAQAGSGHDCALKGAVVTAVVSAPSYMWPQIQRYHFLDIISSQSKMHKITKMDLKFQCTEEVSDDLITYLNDLIDTYNDVLEQISMRGDDKETKCLRRHAHRLFRRIVANTPHGLCLTAGIVTNYLQLKTMGLQREHHKLEEWSNDFMKWLASLPHFEDLTGIKCS